MLEILIVLKAVMQMCSYRRRLILFSLFSLSLISPISPSSLIGSSKLDPNACIYMPKMAPSLAVNVTSAAAVAASSSCHVASRGVNAAAASSVPASSSSSAAAAANGSVVMSKPKMSLSQS